MEILAALVFTPFLLTSCTIQNPTPENYVIKTAKIVKITEGPSFDIIFRNNGTDYYYINRRLELGLNLDSLNAKVLNKTVTLHLAKIVGGIRLEHISQLAVNDEIKYTEFK